MDFESLMDFANGIDEKALVIKDVVIRLVIENKTDTKIASVQVMTTDKENYNLIRELLIAEEVPVHEAQIQYGKSDFCHILPPVNVTFVLFNDPSATNSTE